ncbi:MAG TPA: hypothetical protein VJU81_07575, partial [Methylomirabilota bacterium]|nr:hypothetical protein [Methylomirabilota bacterium]
MQRGELLRTDAGAVSAGRGLVCGGAPGDGPASALFGGGAGAFAFFAAGAGAGVSGVTAGGGAADEGGTVGALAADAPEGGVTADA